MTISHIKGYLWEHYLTFWPIKGTLVKIYQVVWHRSYKKRSERTPITFQSGWYRGRGPDNICHGNRKCWAVWKSGVLLSNYIVWNSNLLKVGRAVLGHRIKQGWKEWFKNEYLRDDIKSLKLTSQNVQGKKSVLILAIVDHSPSEAQCIHMNKCHQGMYKCRAME